MRWRELRTPGLNKSWFLWGRDGGKGLGVWWEMQNDPFLPIWENKSTENLTRAYFKQRRTGRERSVRFSALH